MLQSNGDTTTSCGIETGEDAAPPGVSPGTFDLNPSHTCRVFPLAVAYACIFKMNNPGIGIGVVDTAG